MALIPYDVRGVSSSPPAVLRRRPAKRKAKKGRPPPEPGTFAARVKGQRVDLVDLIENGLPALDYLPRSEGMLLRGKRHMIAAPNKTGKSLGMLVHLVDMVLAGAVAAVLDRENGSEVYARRLADICRARRLSKADREKVSAGLRYFEFPMLRPDDGEALAGLFTRTDLVVFDSQRMFLTDLGLKESESDDYSRFMSYAVDPLFRAGVATVILDNTGHSEKTRARGSASKGDLNEILFSMTADHEFDLNRRGTLRLKVERTRFGNTGEWTMEVGGGTYGPWTAPSGGPERPDVLTAMLAALAPGPMGADPLMAAVRAAGVSVGTVEARDLFKKYVDDPDVPVIHTADGYARDDRAGRPPAAP